MNASALRSAAAAFAVLALAATSARAIRTISPSEQAQRDKEFKEKQAAAEAAAAARKAELAQADGGAGGDEAKPKATMVIEDAPAAPEAPPPTPQGEEKAAIADFIKQQLRYVNKCYEEAVDRRPTLAGKMYAVFYIGPAGRVIGATTQGLQDQDLSSCIVKLVRQWEFEKPKSGGKLMVKYPFVFTPIGR